MNKARHCVRNILCLVAISWIMVNIFSFEIKAKTSFQKTNPVGVMSTAVGNSVVITWEPLAGADGYQLFEYEKESSSTFLVTETEKTKVVLENKNPGRVYCYYVKGIQHNGTLDTKNSKASRVVTTTVPLCGTSTVKNFLQTAIAPVGTTMYVWGGGWNKADTGAGTEARQTGLSPQWRKYAKNQKASYNYRYYKYRIHDGLDCSGYVGWCIYNVLQTENGKKGYVYSASKQAAKFSKLGFGSYTLAKEVRDYKAGDIMSSTCKCCGHVWIVIGQCKDGSVVLVHSSPAGVQINGTVTPKGKKNSQAYRLAKKYMKKYYKSWYQKYPGVSKGYTYLSHYGQMRFTTKGEGIVLSDPDGYQSMDAGAVLKDLFQSENKLAGNGMMIGR